MREEDIQKCVEDICDILDLEPDEPIIEQCNFGSYAPMRDILAACLRRHQHDN